MDVFFIFIVMGIILFSLLSARQKSGSTSLSSDEFEVPEALRTKWASQSSGAMTTHSSVKTRSKKPRIKLTKQMRDANRRNQEQTEELTRSGNGAPRDKNAFRSEAWGRKGHLSGPVFGPLFASLVVAAGLAALFVNS